MHSIAEALQEVHLPDGTDLEYSMTGFRDARVERRFAAWMRTRHCAMNVRVATILSTVALVAETIFWGFTYFNHRHWIGLAPTAVHILNIALAFATASGRLGLSTFQRLTPLRTGMTVLAVAASTSPNVDFWQRHFLRDHGCPADGAFCLASEWHPETLEAEGLEPMLPALLRHLASEVAGFRLAYYCSIVMGITSVYSTPDPSYYGGLTVAVIAVAAAGWGSSGAAMEASFARSLWRIAFTGISLYFGALRLTSIYRDHFVTHVRLAWAQAPHIPRSSRAPYRDCEHAATSIESPSCEVVSEMSTPTSASLPSSPSRLPSPSAPGQAYAGGPALLSSVESACLSSDAGWTSSHQHGGVKRDSTSTADGVQAPEGTILPSPPPSPAHSQQPGGPWDHAGAPAVIRLDTLAGPATSPVDVHVPLSESQPPTLVDLHLHSGSGAQGNLMQASAVPGPAPLLHHPSQDALPLAVSDNQHQNTTHAAAASLHSHGSGSFGSVVCDGMDLEISAVEAALLTWLRQTMQEQQHHHQPSQPQPPHQQSQQPHHHHQLLQLLQQYDLRREQRDDQALLHPVPGTAAGLSSQANDWPCLTQGDLDMMRAASAPLHHTQPTIAPPPTPLHSAMAAAACGEPGLNLPPRLSGLQLPWPLPPSGRTTAAGAHPTPSSLRPPRHPWAPGATPRGQGDGASGAGMDTPPFFLTPATSTVPTPLSSTMAVEAVATKGALKAGDSSTPVLPQHDAGSTPDMAQPEAHPRWAGPGASVGVSVCDGSDSSGVRGDGAAQAEGELRAWYQQTLQDETTAYLQQPTTALESLQPRSLLPQALQTPLANTGKVSDEQWHNPYWYTQDMSSKSPSPTPAVVNTDGPAATSAIPPALSAAPAPSWPLPGQQGACARPECGALSGGITPSPPLAGSGGLQGSGDMCAHLTPEPGPFAPPIAVHDPRQLQASGSLWLVWVPEGTPPGPCTGGLSAGGDSLPVPGPQPIPLTANASDAGAHRLLESQHMTPRTSALAPPGALLDGMHTSQLGQGSTLLEDGAAGAPAAAGPCSGAGQGVAAAFSLHDRAAVAKSSAMQGARSSSTSPPLDAMSSAQRTGTPAQGYEWPVPQSLQHGVRAQAPPSGTDHALRQSAVPSSSTQDAELSQHHLHVLLHSSSGTAQGPEGGGPAGGMRKSACPRPKIVVTASRGTGRLAATTARACSQGSTPSCGSARGGGDGFKGAKGVCSLCGHPKRGFRSGYCPNKWCPGTSAVRVVMRSSRPSNGAGPMVRSANGTPLTLDGMTAHPPGLAATSRTPADGDCATFPDGYAALPSVGPPAGAAESTQVASTTTSS